MKRIEEEKRRATAEYLGQDVLSTDRSLAEQMGVSQPAYSSATPSPSAGSGQASGGGQTQTEWAKQIKKQMDLFKEEADVWADFVGGSKEAHAQALKYAQETWKEEQRLAEQAMKIDGRVFDEKKKRLEAEYEELKEHAEDKEALDIWYAQESSKIEKERLESMRDKAKSFSEWRSYQRKLDTRDFLSEGEKQARDWLEMHQRMQRATEDFSRAVGDTLGSVLFDGMTGQMKTFEGLLGVGLEGHGQGRRRCRRRNGDAEDRGARRGVGH